MHSTLNTELLAGMIRSKRGTKGLRAASEEIGNVSAPTLSRIEQGKIPDVETFIKLCNWLEVSTETFISQPSIITISNKEQAVAHLRADRELNAETVNMLVKMIDLAYSSK
jgi:transcriptional regulator with XRE-family HTH domain